MFKGQFFSEELKNFKSPNEASEEQSFDYWRQVLKRDVRKRLSNNDVNLRKYYHLLTDKIMIEEALHYCDSNKSKAAKKLGVSRMTLRVKMEECETYFKKMA